VHRQVAHERELRAGALDALGDELQSGELRGVEEVGRLEVPVTLRLGGSMLFASMLTFAPVTFPFSADSVPENLVNLPCTLAITR
jgi:hypothetical protein